MAIIVWQTLKEPKHAPAVKSKIQEFLKKLQQDDTALGLHIEPIANAKDPRVRTGRVDQFWRAVLFRFDPPGSEPVYVYAGTWPHDDAIEKAKRTVAKQNPVNSLVAFTEELDAVESHQPSTPAAPFTADHHTQSHTPQSLLTELRFTQNDLTGEFGFAPAIATAAMACTTEDELLEYALTLPDLWQQDVLAAMGAGTPLHEIRERLSLTTADTADTIDQPENPDARIVAALKLPAARMQFHFIEGDDDEELRRIIEGGDFGAWRVFLHPEQRQYVERNYNGPFRLSGGAGTGKTVVLLHRTRWLQQQNPDARIVLSTFSRALAQNLARDLERLDPQIRFASELGKPGVLVRGVDQLAAEIRALAGSEFRAATAALLGAERELSSTPHEPDWQTAIDHTDDSGEAAFTGEITHPSFYISEYAQVVLPAAITSRDTYFGVRRPGRGLALSRPKRALVWRTIEQMRANERLSEHLSYSEIAASAAGWLRDSQRSYADHILVDEGQDLEPVKWQMLRALVAEAPNDLFIADDSHQKIYGQGTVFSRYGINIRGRSRRLTLNYRTTHQNLRYALELLSGAEYVDSEEEKLTLEGYRSIRTGPRPSVLTADTPVALTSHLAEVIAGWVDAGVEPHSVAILTSSNHQSEFVQRELAAHNQRVDILRSHANNRDSLRNEGGGHPVVLTMQRAKGLEFSRVILFDVSEQSYPPRAALRDLTGSELDARLQQYRSLLYVAASRARDELVVTWTNAPSAILSATNFIA